MPTQNTSTPTRVPERCRAAYLAGRRDGQAAAQRAPLPDEVAREVVRVLDDRVAVRS